MATSTEAIVDPGAVAKLLPKKDSVVGKVKLKKPPPKAKPEADGPPSPKSPLLNTIDAELRKTFESGRPMEDIPNLIQCKHCKKPMLATVAHSHIKICLQKKNERAQKKKEQKEANRKAREAREKAEKAEKDAQEAESDEESTMGDKGGAAKKAVKSATGKKRKADGEAEKNPKKKTKKEIEAAKPKVAKPKGPVDVEKQCGVLLPNGAMCARSLTCKSHAMGAKRAVPGRSQPYDYLLAAYQKKNQAKQQKAAMDANAPLPEDVAEDQGPIDSDEEKDLVMAGIARSRPGRPMAQHIHVPFRKRYQQARIKEMLSNALLNRGANAGNSAAGNTAAAASSSNAGANNTNANPNTNAGATTAAATEATETEQRRSSMVQANNAKGSGSGALSRKPSAASLTSTVTPAVVAT